jgi:hypothetical protein
MPPTVFGVGNERRKYREPQRGDLVAFRHGKNRGMPFLNYRLANWGELSPESGLGRDPSPSAARSDQN